MQTVQTKFRCHIMWHLIRVYIFCKQGCPTKIQIKQQIRPDTPIMTNGLIQHITVESSKVLYQPYYSMCLPVVIGPGLLVTGFVPGGNCPTV